MSAPKMLNAIERLQLQAIAHKAIAHQAEIDAAGDYDVDRGWRVLEAIASADSLSSAASSTFARVNDLGEQIGQKQWATAWGFVAEIGEALRPFLPFGCARSGYAAFDSVHAWLTGDYSEIFPLGIDWSMHSINSVADAAKIAIAHRRSVSDYERSFRIYEAAYAGDLRGKDDAIKLGVYDCALPHLIAGDLITFFQIILGCSAEHAYWYRVCYDTVGITYYTGGLYRAVLAEVGRGTDPSEIQDLIAEKRDIISRIAWEDDLTLQEMIAACEARYADHAYNATNEAKLLAQIAGGIDVYHGTADIARYRERDHDASICYAIERETAERYARRAVGSSGASGHKMIDDRATIVTARIPRGASIASSRDVDEAVWAVNGRHYKPDRFAPNWSLLDMPAIQRELRDRGFKYAIIRDGCDTDYLAIRALVRTIDVAEDLL